MKVQHEKTEEMKPEKKLLDLSAVNISTFYVHEWPCKAAQRRGEVKRQRPIGPVSQSPSWFQKGQNVPLSVSYFALIFVRGG
jgi:hypothetical protein